MLSMEWMSVGKQMREGREERSKRVMKRERHVWQEKEVSRAVDEEAD